MSKPNMQSSDKDAIRELHPTSDFLEEARKEAETAAEKHLQRSEASKDAEDAGVQVRGWNLDAVRRLKHAVEAFGGPTFASQKAGVSLSTLNAAIAGRNEPKIGFLAHIAQVVGISLDWILWGSGEPILPGDRGLAPREEASSDLLQLPFYDVRASAGPGALPLQEEPTAVFNVDRRFAQTVGIVGSDVIALPVHGDSGQPGLSEGDLIIVDRSFQELRDGGMYVIGVDTDIIVKRVHRQADRSVVLRSDNPAYDPQHIAASDVEHLRVIGRVRWALRGM